MQNYRQRSIVAIINGVDGVPYPTFTLRIESLLSHLKSVGFDVRYMKYDQYLASPCNSDYLVIQRFVSFEVGTSVKIAEALISKAKSENSQVLYDVDDNFEDMSYLMRLKLSKNIEVFNYLKNHVDLILVSTTELQKKLNVDTKTFLMPNYMFQEPTHLRNLSPKNEIVLGYVGNVDRILDLITVLLWFSESLKNRRRIVLESLGFSDEILGTLKEILPEIEFRNSDPIEYQNLHHWIADRHWTASLAPLEENKFNVCKSAIKLIDYSWNLAPIAISSVGEVAEMFDASFPDFLLLPVNFKDSKSNWLNWLNRLLENDPDIYRNDHLLRSKLIDVRGVDPFKSQIGKLCDELISIAQEI